MKHVKQLLSFCLLILCGMPLWSQQLMITKEFEEVQFSNVLALYKNEFGKHEKPALDDTFPYALFQVQLEGNASEVKKAKELLRFYVTDDTRHIPVRIDFYLRFGTAKAFYILSRTVKVMYRIGASMQLRRLGYKMEKMNLN